jgi:allophanate hydrolase subunit 1
MTPEEMERAINFIVEHQAQFAADIQQLKEAQVITEQKLQQFADIQLGQAKLQTQLTEATLANTIMLGQLTKTQQQTNEKLAETDERLNIFINVVERHITGSNGK